MLNEKMAEIWGVNLATTEFSKRLSVYLDTVNSGVFRDNDAAIVDHVKKVFYDLSCVDRSASDAEDAVAQAAAIKLEDGQ